MPSPSQWVTGWPLPETIETEGTQCVTLKIPNDPTYRAAFQGALSELATWINWEKSGDRGDNRATRAAQLWRELLDEYLEIGACGVIDVRQNPTQPCRLDKTEDGTVWVQFANLRLCIPYLKAEGGEILQSSDGVTWTPIDNDGTIGSGQPGEQPGGSTPIPSGSCVSLTVVVQANQQFMIPFRVLPDDFVTITEVSGVWYFSPTFFLNFRCADGNLFALGQCTGTSVDTDPTGIDGVNKAGRLIARYGSAFLDPVAGSVVIPSGNEHQLIFQMNDSELSDNGGSMSFVLTVCSGEWCYFIDFTETQGGFTSLDSYSEWVSGVGFRSIAGPTFHDVYIGRSVDLQSGTTVVMEYSVVSQGTGSAYSVRYFLNSSLIQLDSQPNSGTVTSTSNQFSNSLALDANSGAISSGGGVVTITSVRFTGRGTNPFGTNNCT